MIKTDRLQFCGQFVSKASPKYFCTVRQEGNETQRFNSSPRTKAAWTNIVDQKLWQSSTFYCFPRGKEKNYFLWAKFGLRPILFQSLFFSALCPKWAWARFRNLPNLPPEQESLGLHWNNFFMFPLIILYFLEYEAKSNITLLKCMPYCKNKNLKVLSSFWYVLFFSEPSFIQRTSSMFLITFSCWLHCSVCTALRFL